jgi:CRP/FNR family transcriptional regulator
MNKIESLKKTELFGSLKTAELKAISEVCVERKLQKDQILFQAGDDCEGLFVIAKGSVRAIRENLQGREQVIHIEKAGATIAEVPVFDDQPYPSTVVAEEESELLFISTENVKKFCLKYPSIGLSALRLLAARLRKTAALVESLSLKEVDQRLAAFLLQEFADKRLNKITLPANSVIAARLGTVREVVSRALSKLEREKLVSVDEKHTITLLDTQKLGNYANK